MFLFVFLSYVHALFTLIHLVPPDVRRRSRREADAPPIGDKTKSIPNPHLQKRRRIFAASTQVADELREFDECSCLAHTDSENHVQPNARSANKSEKRPRNGSIFNRSWTPPITRPPTHSPISRPSNSDAFKNRTEILTQKG